MRTLNILISEIELDEFGSKKDKISFSEFVELVSKELTRQTLNRCSELAEKYGLDKMSMAEIAREVKAVRKNAKGRN